LLRTGTPIEELRLADAALLAGVTTGAAYPRFPKGQDEFRMAVLAAILRDAPRYRDVGLTALAGEMLAKDRSTLEPEDVPDVIEAVTAQQQQRMRDDDELPLRLYAVHRVAQANTDAARAIVDELRDRDERTNEEWAMVVKTIAEELGVRPNADVSYHDFEIAVSSLLTGLALRQRTSELPEGIYGRLVEALIIGFFSQKERVPRKTVRQILVGFLNGTKRMTKTQKLLREAMAQESEEGDEAPLAVTSEGVLETVVSEPVRRALEAAQAGSRSQRQRRR
jgi:hypothetical protein